MTDFNYSDCPVGAEVKAIMGELDKKVDKILKLQEKQNGRVDRLESWRDKILGGFVIIAIIIGGYTAGDIIHFIKQVFSR